MSRILNTTTINDGWFKQKRPCLKVHLIEVVPDLWYFYLTMVQKWCAFSRYHTSNFEGWSFPGWVLLACSTILFPDAGQWQWATVTSWPHNCESKQQIPDRVQCCLHFLAIMFCDFTSHHVYTMSIWFSCFWWGEEEEGSYSWDTTWDTCPSVDGKCSEHVSGRLG